ncbi:MAG: hypothetical protein ABIS86_15670 [Streptosporangiaceae bacterium]
MISPRTRLFAAVPLAALTLGLAAGCSSDNASCTGTTCTITFDRGVNAKASILGIEAELVSVAGQNVTLRVAGQQLTVPINDNETSGNFDVKVTSVTKDNVIVTISQN